MDIYSLLQKFADNLENETDRKAATEVINGLKGINAFGSAAYTIRSETKEAEHVHVKVTEWDMRHPGMLHDICGVCKKVLRNAYEPMPNNPGYNYQRSWRGS